MENPRYSPGLEEFREKARTYNVIQVEREILADTETPVSAFLKIDDGAEAFLLESVEGGEKWGRYSFIGTSPMAVIRGKGRIVEIIEGGPSRTAGGKKTVREGDPLEVLKDYMSRFRSAPLAGASRFSGGAIGYLGYDIIRHMEKLPDKARKDLDLYDLFFIITDTLLVFDNGEHKIKVVCNARVTDGRDVAEVYGEAVGKIDSLVLRLREAKLPSPHPPTVAHITITNFPKADFIEAIGRVKKYIGDGDIIQAVISQRFETELNCRPFDLYRALRTTNPSPYMFFLRLGGIALAGSSPEILVRVDGGDITLRPIAGTRRRGADPAEDLLLEEELLGDPKERAEHLMLVDLGRNDVGRVAKAGTVHVDELMAIERYSHVMHIVSNVQGRMRDDVDSFGVLRACFPAGTLTGAPKIRAMEIIEEVEPSKRGVYGGSVGYISFSGNMDMCITIRTLLIKDGRIYIQAGAGIVADSDPEKEYEETVNKARGMLKAVEMARAGFQ
ncbi:MAG: anthranilate synthase component I [Deltaproteobacteria bacterium]|nr:anthranilate synthase component I [Deltaproteobacteria bacterium]